MRITIAGCGITLLAVLFLPIWQIQLAAPQYPEGLVLLIYANKLSGSVDIINGLNHYIGMKTLHTSDFIEFTLLPYIIIAYALFLFITAIVGKRKLLNVTLIAFILFGIVAMVDFYNWEYNYGHNLDPDAAIKVPGMAYQPPLIGYKQLLNFGAYSIPDIGGWLFITVGITLFVMVVLSWKAIKPKKPVSYTSKEYAAVITILFVTATIVSCNVKPQALKLGVDNCSFCKMTVSDPRFGGELITKKGKIYKFDDVHCLLSFMKSSAVPGNEIRDVYLVTFDGHHGFIKADEALLLKSAALHTPMNGNVAAFIDFNDYQTTLKEVNGIASNWTKLMSE